MLRSAAVIGQRHQAAAIGHHLFGALRHRGEGIAADVHGHAEIFRRGIDIAALELVLVGKADGMDHEIQAVPDLPQFGEGGIDGAWLGDVAIDQRGGL